MKKKCHLHFTKRKMELGYICCTGKKLTADTNKDGKIDRYGVNFWAATALVYSNGVAFVSIDKTGKGKLNFDNAALQRALNFYKKGAKEGWLARDWDITVSGLKRDRP